MRHLENPADFEAEVIKSDIPVLVDFWADWCGPCKTLKPIVSEISKDYDGRVKVVMVDAEACGDIASRFGVRGLPTLMLFKAGDVVAMRSGAIQKGALANWIDAAVA